MNFLSAKKKQWPHLQETILNIDWLAENEKTLKEIYPKHYTSMRMICPVVVGMHLSLLGVPYRSAEELQFIVYLLQRTGILLTKNMLIKRNPRSIFKAGRKTPKFRL